MSCLSPFPTKQLPLTLCETDVVKQYITEAVEQDFAVIDVNVPKHLTGVEDDSEHAEETNAEQRKAETLKLASYLWENYIE